MFSSIVDFARVHFNDGHEAEQLVLEIDRLEQKLGSAKWIIVVFWELNCISGIQYGLMSVVDNHAQHVSVMKKRVACF